VDPGGESSCEVSHENLTNVPNKMSVATVKAQWEFARLLMTGVHVPKTHRPSSAGPHHILVHCLISSLPSGSCTFGDGVLLGFPAKLHPRL